MRIRIKTKWSKKDREVSVEDAIGVLAFNSWKIGMQVLLDIESEEFQVDTQMQRIRIMEEIMCFMVHCVDRLVYHNLADTADRAHLITYYATKLSDHVHDNARDFEPNVDHRSPFIAKLNQRMDSYADCKWNDEDDKPGFSMSREFAENIRHALGDRDSQWVLDYIQQVALPDFYQPFKKTIHSVGLIDDKQIQ